MDHLAILNKSWKLLDKILSGEKTIESRWYVTKRIPWNKIQKGETIYLKNSGEPVTAKATVEKVTQLELDKEKVLKLLKIYGLAIGIVEGKIPEFYERFKDKKYCILINLKEPQKIEPFNIDKKGFGLMSAWITVKDIKEITHSHDNSAL